MASLSGFELCINEKALDSALCDKFEVPQSKGIKYVEMLCFQSVRSQIVITSSFAFYHHHYSQTTYFCGVMPNCFDFRESSGGESFHRTSERCLTNFWWSFLCGLPSWYLFTLEVISYSHYSWSSWKFQWLLDYRGCCHLRAESSGPAVGMMEVAEHLMYGCGSFAAATIAYVISGKVAKKTCPSL